VLRRLDAHAAPRDGCAQLARDLERLEEDQDRNQGERRERHGKRAAHEPRDPRAVEVPPAHEQAELVQAEGRCERGVRQREHLEEQEEQRRQPEAVHDPAPAAEQLVADVEPERGRHEEDHQRVVPHLAQVQDQHRRKRRQREEREREACSRRAAEEARAESREQEDAREPRQREGQAQPQRLRVRVLDAAGEQRAERAGVVLPPGRADVGVELLLEADLEWPLQLEDHVAAVVHLRVAELEDALAVHRRLRLVVPEQRIGEVLQYPGGEERGDDEDEGHEGPRRARAALRRAARCGRSLAHGLGAAGSLAPAASAKRRDGRAGRPNAFASQTHTRLPARIDGRSIQR
jgi:hypothetical protein